MTLEHLDTALGFAVIMLLLSLLITVLVQTVTAVLGLRGSNLTFGHRSHLEAQGDGHPARRIDPRTRPDVRG